MIGINELNRWLAPPLTAVLLAAGAVSSAFASSSASPTAIPSCSAERGRPPERPIPPGQIVRRGVVGKVVAVITAGGTNTRIVVETKFGNVEMTVPQGFDVSLVMVGSRIAALMDKEPVTTGSAPALTDTPFRIGNASRITVIPTESTRSHNRAVVQSQDGAALEVIDENGAVGKMRVTGKGGVQAPPVEGPTPPELAIEQEQVEAGTDVVLLTQCTDPQATPMVRSIQNADRVVQRLERLQAKFEERKSELAAKLADLQQQRQERQEARLQQMADKAPPEARDKAEKALRKARGEDEEASNGQGSSEGKGKGPPEDKGKSK